MKHLAITPPFQMALQSAYSPEIPFRLVEGLEAKALPQLGEGLTQSPFLRDEEEWLGKTLGEFLTVSTTITGRGSFYNTLEEQTARECLAHDQLFQLDRGVYATLLSLEGVLHRARQQGVFQLLSTPSQEPSLFLNKEEESQVIEHLLREMTPPRMFRVFCALRRQQVNNRHTRRIILQSILNHSNLELWSVRYRRKIRQALQHAWGIKRTGYLKKVLAHTSTGWTDEEKKALSQYIGKYSPHRSLEKVAQCVAFILGVKGPTELPLLQAYEKAPFDVEAGKDLPWETLEGLVSQYHPEVSSAQVLELTRNNLTKGQRLAFQKRAQEQGVKVEVNLSKYDAVRLYQYAFQNGMTKKLSQKLAEKARKEAGKFPWALGRIGVLVDASQSMTGPDIQKWRPMSCVLALADLLQVAASESMIHWSGERREESSQGGTLVWPEGATQLASGLIGLLKEELDCLFILSDGYENSLAGEVNLVLHRARQLGRHTPVYQFSPVYAAEAGGVRSLSDQLTALPLTSIQGMETSLLKGLLCHSPLEGLAMLYHKVLPRLVNKSQKETKSFIEG